MPLRLKVYFIVGATLIALAAALYGVSQTVIMRAFDRLETNDVREKVAEVLALLDGELTDLRAFAEGYSSWDETAAFLKDLDRADVEAGPDDSFLIGSTVSMAVLVHSDGTIALSRRFDGKTTTTDSPPTELGPYLHSESPLVRHASLDSEFSGLLMLPEGPMLMASRPILATEDGGPVRGALITGRWLDLPPLTVLRDRTRVLLQVIPLASQQLPPEVREVAVTTAPERGAVVVPLGADAVGGFFTLEDVFGAKVAVLEVSAPRVIHEEGAKALLYFVFALAGAVVIFGIAAAGLLERSLFRRMGRLTSQIRRFRLGQDEAASIALRGNDELAVLARTVDTSLTRLENMRVQQERQARSLSQTLDELKGRHRDLEKAHRRLQQLQEASVTLGGSLEITDALARLEHVTLDIFEADEVWLLRLHGGRRPLHGMRAFFRKTAGRATLPQVFGCEQADGVLDQEANSLLRAAFSGSPAIFIESLGDLPADEQERLFRGSPPELGRFRSLALVPLYAEEGPVGLIISASARTSAFPADKRSTILLFASQIAQALKNTRLYEEIKALGEIDSLSGLYNRRRSLEQLEIEVGRARRYRGTFSVLIADVDNFKLFNDTYGHPAGDEIIRRVAGLLQNRSRTSDFVGRFGGDEFILILPETYRAGARTLADHLRTALNSVPYVAPDGALIPLRMSFGAASFPEDGWDAASLIAVADANLYESKRWGGDMITVRSEPVAGEAVNPQAFSTLDALVSAVDNKDHYTRRHSAHVAEYAVAIARRLGFGEEREELLRVAALLHDVGKIGVPDRILRKPGALTAEEVEFMENHSLIGSTMISQYLPGLTDVRDAVVSHHERWDGKGYPAGLRGTDIPMLGRILAVADAYCAMITDRPYRAALAPQEAVVELINGSGTQFDPDIVRVFVDHLSGEAEKAPGLGAAESGRVSGASRSAFL